jgi:hypothetical protein
MTRTGSPLRTSGNPALPPSAIQDSPDGDEPLPQCRSFGSGLEFFTSGSSPLSSEPATMTPSTNSLKTGLTSAKGHPFKICTSRPIGFEVAVNAPQRKRARAAAEFEALSSIKCFVDVVCHGPADFALRRHSSVARRSAVVIVLAIGKPSPRPCLESSQSPSGVPAARSTRTMAQ